MRSVVSARRQVSNRIGKVRLESLSEWRTLTSSESETEDRGLMTMAKLCQIKRVSSSTLLIHRPSVSNQITQQILACSLAASHNSSPLLHFDSPSTDRHRPLGRQTRRHFRSPWSSSVRGPPLYLRSFRAPLIASLRFPSLPFLRLRC